MRGPLFTAFLLHGFTWLEKARWQSSQQSLAEFATQSLERLHDKAMQKAERMDWQHAADRHALRIRVKRLRYACDSLAESFAAAIDTGYDIVRHELTAKITTSLAHEREAELTLPRQAAL